MLPYFDRRISVCMRISLHEHGTVHALYRWSAHTCRNILPVFSGGGGGGGVMAWWRWYYGMAVISLSCIFGEMVLKVAPFRAENREAAQLELIFRTTGSPKGPTLSAVYEPLEQWRNFEASRKTYERNFIAKFPESQMTHSGLDLLEQLLDLDPNTRISADHALEHSYFSDWKQPEE